MHRDLLKSGFSEGCELLSRKCLAHEMSYEQTGVQSYLKYGEKQRQENMYGHENKVDRETCRDKLMFLRI